MRTWPRHNLISAHPFDPSGYDDHGAFFAIIDDVVRRSLKRVGAKHGGLPVVAPRSILGDSKAFEQRMEQVVREMPHEPGT